MSGGAQPAPSSEPFPSPPPEPVRVPIDTELAVREQAAGPFAWRFAYARAADRQARGRVGQDYLTFQVDAWRASDAEHGSDAAREAEQESAQGSGRFAFVLCDGVGQSFFGDLAARFLGDRLLAWLWAVPPDGVTADDLGEHLTAWLTDLTGDGTAMVQAHEASANLAPLVAQVLERKRTEGSATTMVGGLVEVTDAGRLRLVVTALGDSRLRVWVDDEEIVVHEATEQTGAGWSTRRGVVGGPPSLSVYNSHLRPIRLLAYSDGLVGLDAISDRLAGAELQALIDASQDEPTSDDVAVLDVWLRAADASAPLAAEVAEAAPSSAAPDATAESPATHVEPDADLHLDREPPATRPLPGASAASASRPSPSRSSPSPADDPGMAWERPVLRLPERPASPPASTAASAKPSAVPASSGVPSEQFDFDDLPPARESASGVGRASSDRPAAAPARSPDASSEPRPIRLDDDFADDAPAAPGEFDDSGEPSIFAVPRPSPLHEPGGRAAAPRQRSTPAVLVALIVVLVLILIALLVYALLPNALS